MKKKQILIDILPRIIWIIQGLVLFLIHKYINYQPKLTGNLLWLIIGWLMIVIGLIFMIWISRFLTTKLISARKLVTNGPYQYARHPMYVAIYIILIGVGILFFSIHWFIILLIFIPFWCVECKIEEKQLIKLYGQEYLNYKKKVGMFFSF